MRRKGSQGHFIVHTRGADLKGDLVFEYLVLHQDQGGGSSLAEVRGHEVSDKDTKQPFGAMLASELDGQWQNGCVPSLTRLWDMVEDRWNEVLLFLGLLSWLVEQSSDA